MGEMEKMDAVKRAYAEMILNTAKEAAERVMAADLRARRTEQELVTVKEDSAHMLLRLKQMIDAKTKEAEITSLNQNKKFEELESQLNEAEGIILDLREELNQEQEQLDKFKKKQVLLKRQKEENAEERSLMPVVTCRDYELLASSLNSIPEFSTIGTQRTCATETSLEEQTFYVVEKLNESKKITNIESVNADRTTSELEEKIQHGNSESVSIVRRSVRKRKLKFWGDVIAACGLQSSHQLKKPHQGSTDLSCLATRKDSTKIESFNDAEVSNGLINTEALAENMELIDVLVKQDELAAAFELTSASKIDCEFVDGTAANTSNLSCDDGDKLCQYTFNRRWRKKSAIYPEKILAEALDI